MIRTYLPESDRIGVYPMRRRVLAVLMGSVAMGLSTLAPPAQASPLCSVGGICGVIENIGGSTIPLLVTCGWTNKSPNYYLSPGEKSSRYCLDADGFNVPSSSIVYVCRPSRYGYIRESPGWHKVRDDIALHRYAVRRGACPPGGY